MPVTAFLRCACHLATDLVEWREACMATLYFHCAGRQEVLLDRRGSEMEDIFDVKARAVQIIQAMITSVGPEDWREWNVHVRTGEGDELLLVPFSTVLGKPH
jgi:hypothetical protein